MVVFFVAVKKCEIPWWNPLDESLAKNSIGFKKLISRGWPLRGGYHISGYFSIQNEMACFPNSWGILLYWFVALNVTMGVSGSIFVVWSYEK